MKRLIECRNIIPVLAVVLMCAVSAKGDIVWGYEKWVDKNPADGKIDEWGTYNLDFKKDTSSKTKESLAVAHILKKEVWGKTWYGTGVHSDAIISEYKYLFIETYDIQGNIKIAVSGANDKDYYEITSFAIKGKTGGKNIITDPGPYLFDISNWKPREKHQNVYIHLIAEGGRKKGFTINRIFLTNTLKDTPFNKNQK